VQYGGASGQYTAAVQATCGSYSPEEMCAAPANVRMQQFFRDPGVICSGVIVVGWQRARRGAPLRGCSARDNVGVVSLPQGLSSGSTVYYRVGLPGVWSPESVFVAPSDDVDATGTVCVGAVSGARHACDGASARRIYVLCGPLDRGGTSFGNDGGTSVASARARACVRTREPDGDPCCRSLVGGERRVRSVLAVCWRFLVCNGLLMVRRHPVQLRLLPAALAPNVHCCHPLQDVGVFFAAHRTASVIGTLHDSRW
jgi:hypothetical protein